MVTITTITPENRADIFRDAEENSYYTIIGCGGDLNKWVNGYNNLFSKNGIGNVEHFFTFKGADMNTHYELTGDVAYPDDLTFLMFAIDGLKLSALATMRMRLCDKWFDDIVWNNDRHLGRI